MTDITLRFIKSLGILRDLESFLVENPQILQEDPGFSAEVIEQISIVVGQHYSEEEMVSITHFHESDEGQAWLNKNGDMADDIDKLFKAHVVSRLSQELFSELNLLPSTEEEEPSIN